MKKRQKRPFTDSEWLQHTAAHEAGHAVMAVHFGFPLGSVSIESDGFSAGVTQTPEAGEMMTQHPDSLFGYEKEIIISMAGTEAGKAVLPKLARPPWGDGDDLHQIDVRVNQLCTFTEERETNVKRRLRHMTEWYTADPAIRSAIADFATELLDKKTIPKARAKKLIKQILKKYHREYYPERFIEENSGCC